MAKSKWESIKARFPDIEKWLKEGLNQKQIIHNLGIGKTSFEAYKKQHPELAELLNIGKETQNEEVKNSLFKASTGFYYYVEEAVKVKDAEGNEDVRVVTVKKFSPPQTEAMKYWLNNRDKKHWANNPQILDIRREELEHRKNVDGFKNF